MTNDDKPQAKLEEKTRQWLESRPELVRRIEEMRRICEYHMDEPHQRHSLQRR